MGILLLSGPLGARVGDYDNDVLSVISWASRTMEICFLRSAEIRFQRD
jgi:hypothetical protein